MVYEEQADIKNLPIPTYAQMELILDKAYMNVKERSFKVFLRFISDLGQSLLDTKQT